MGNHRDQSITGPVFAAGGEPSKQHHDRRRAEAFGDGAEIGQEQNGQFYLFIFALIWMPPKRIFEKSLGTF